MERHRKQLSQPGGSIAIHRPVDNYFGVNIDSWQPTEYRGRHDKNRHLTSQEELLEMRDKGGADMVAGVLSQILSDLDLNPKTRKKSIDYIALIKSRVPGFRSYHFPTTLDSHELVDLSEQMTETSLEKLWDQDASQTVSQRNALSYIKQAKERGLTLEQINDEIKKQAEAQKARYRNAQKKP